MNTEQEIRYSLERYKPGGSNRYCCPQCGKKKCFVRYIDRETGEYLGEDCGKCNHTASCGYHYPPKDFFRDHPELRPHRDFQPEYVNGKPLLRLGNSKSLQMSRPKEDLPKEEEEQTVFFSRQWVETSMLRSSTFSQWLEGLGMADNEQVKRVLTDYCVGGTAKDTIVNGTNYGPAVVFWQIDEQGRAHDAKLMAYHANGHRVADWCNFMRSICQRMHVGPQLEHTQKVLFGLHLLPKCPDKTVCIVESEKTALLCACIYPQYLWLGTGGCGNLQAEKLLPLKNRRVMVIPDSGEYQKWKECMERSQLEDYSVASFMEQYPPNTDIADILLA